MIIRDYCIYVKGKLQFKQSAEDLQFSMFSNCVTMRRVVSCCDRDPFKKCILDPEGQTTLGKRRGCLLLF